MTKNKPFLGRTLAVVSDLNVDEQRYLYNQTRIFKQAWLAKDNVSQFRIDDTELSIYLIFMEDSTRTKESFRNAALFHNANVNIFDSATSSFKKSESLVDTIKMLYGYSRHSIFIMRTKMEGVCRALEGQLSQYAKSINRPMPIFINAGDGRHEHPTQEFLDEFTFLEQKNWDTSHIHIALIGDLLHGRTVHSKTDGLKIFDSVKVDLVAPPELTMPENYINRMQDNGFQIRQWDSIEQYLESGDISLIWYFTRLQLERMGDEIKEKESELRQAVVFRKEWVDKMPEGTRFYHPLPRHKGNPVIPTFLDNTPLNGWDGQSINGYFTRVIELAMFSGKLGKDFSGQELSKPATEREWNTPASGQLFSERAMTQEFILQAQFSQSKHKEDRFKVGIKPVENGTVIDHIAKGQDIPAIWNQIDKIRRILNLNRCGSHGVFETMLSGQNKGIISLPDVMEFEESDLRKLAAVSPGCTLNIIKDHSIQAKYRVKIPPKIYNFPAISCKNPDCVTWPEAQQQIPPYFLRSNDDTFTCCYCEKTHKYGEIWDI